MPATASTSTPATNDNDGRLLEPPDSPPGTPPATTDRAAAPAGAPPDDDHVRRTSCDNCGATVPQDDTITTLGGAEICPSCQRADYWCCPDCGGWNRDGWVCANNCDDEDEDDEDDERGDDEPDGDLINSYSYKPVPVFHGTGPLFLGLELEIATPYDRWESAHLAARRLGTLGYLKADESIGGGFEVVTHPMTYPWALTHFPWELLPALGDVGCRATERTGLHVHLSRDGFTSPAHVYRWMKFVYRNQPAVTALARRVSCEWAEFADDDRHRVKDYAKGSLGYYRYRAINTQNAHTFELRIFASSLQPVQVQAALGFAAASVAYTRALTVAAITRRDGWAWPAFTGWLTGRPLYEPLLDQVQALTGVPAGGSTCAC